MSRSCSSADTRRSATKRGAGAAPPSRGNASVARTETPKTAGEVVTGPSTEDWELWTWREVAWALKVSRSWVYAKAERGELPSLRVGGLLRFDPTEVRRFATSAPG
jgi:excisionase family DNA binding protein